MLIYLDDPARLKSMPLMPHRLRPAPDDDFSIHIAELRLGRIMRSRQSFQVIGWFWTMTGPCCALDRLKNIETNGFVGSLQDAKTALRTSFDRWLGWAIKAGAAGVDVAWLQ